MAFTPLSVGRLSFYNAFATVPLLYHKSNKISPVYAASLLFSHIAALRQLQASLFSKIKAAFLFAAKKR